jgi:hypothetical protein
MSTDLEGQRLGIADNVRRGAGDRMSSAVNYGVRAVSH